MATYTYTPPTWSFKHTLEGSLRYGIDTFTVTYKKAGVWTNVQVTGVGELDGATNIYTLPTVVDAATAAELQAFGIGTVTIT